MVVQIIQQQPEPLKRQRIHKSFLPQSASSVARIYRPEFVDPSIVEWVESIESDSYRARQCRSDSGLSRSDTNYKFRRRAKSAPMDCRQDDAVLLVPPTPASIRSQSYVPSMENRSTSMNSSSAGSSRKKGVEDPKYRRKHLAQNNISLHPYHEDWPEHVAKIVTSIRKERSSPGPSLEDIRHDDALHDLETGDRESAVEGYFGKIFTKPSPTSFLRRDDRIPMSKEVVPNINNILNLKITNPIPDMLFGYREATAFPQRFAQFDFWSNELEANSQGLICPFLIIEFKADGPGVCGSLWVATNQCLGGSASCVNIAENLNSHFRECNATSIPSNGQSFIFDCDEWNRGTTVCNLAT